MRARLVLAVVASTLLVAPALAAPPFKATFWAPTHTPKVNTRWPYRVTATDLHGKPIAAKLTVQVVDPFGGVHAVQFYANTKNVVNHPFVGTFKDAVKWPPESRGFKLTLRLIVKAKGGTVTLLYKVTSR